MFNPSELKGVIFDLDGVLTDTAEFHYQAWQQLADETGLPFDREANEALRGLSRRESLMRILGDRTFSEEAIQSMMDKKNGYYVALIQNITAAELLPGSVALLDELRQAGIKAAIGSGSKNARTIIDKLGIGDRIDAISDGYSVSNSKPAPDVFLHAAGLLGLEPSQCAVVEDAGAGVEAALAAGMWAIGLGPAERVGAAHVVLPSLDGITLTDLTSKLAQAQPG
ncbi:MAG: beta-phosphoglucomutase [Leptolyngbyaceae cyanobacterium MO_188.B28]|nr:beta-phosphoglucomutase [Leptolyngbyaceae cyanobacterium MO_188.B28]